MTAETLNCPNCGAGVASDSTQCEFCHTRLKTVACPNCLDLMFFGSKFCDHCGVAAVDAKTASDAKLGLCPRCKRGLDRLQIDAIVVSECKSCGGIWSDAATFEKICSEKEEQSAALAYFGNQPQNSRSNVAINYVPCPSCKQLMNRSNFARSSGVIVDLCKDHGVWFDAGELPKIVEFIESGGLERSREKEKIDLEAERQQLRRDRREFESHDAGSDLFGSPHAGERSVGGDLIKKLFDL